MKSQIISIRMNQEELQNLKTVMKEHKAFVRSQFIKEVLFSEIKPYLDLKERELFMSCIYELNALGRNLNQLLKFKAYTGATCLVKDAKLVVQEIEKIL